MTTAIKTLGQSSPAATTWTTMYTCPAATGFVGSTLAICNTNSVQALVRVALRVDAAALATKHYLLFDVPVPAGQTLTLTLGITGDASDLVDVYSSVTGVAFQLFGSEES